MARPMTQAQVRNVLARNADATIYVNRGEVYLDDGDAVRMISPSILCGLNKARFIQPLNAPNASIWVKR